MIAEHDAIRNTGIRKLEYPGRRLSEHLRGKGPGGGSLDRFEKRSSQTKE